MITKIGTSPNYQDLFFQYMNFLATGIEGSEKVYPWLIIDPRLDTFYGSTLVVPTGEYTVHEDAIKIWVDMCENSLVDDEHVSFYNDIYTPNGEYNNLIDTLRHCYPNGVVEEINTTYITADTTALENVYSKLQATPISDLPNVLICCGLLKSIGANSGVWDSYIDIELNNIFTFCQNNNIKLYCCVAPSWYEVDRYDNLFNQIESFISNTGERLINLPVKFVDMFNTLSAVYSKYRNYVHSYSYQGTLVRTLLQEFMGLDRPEYYVSFEYRTITSSSYREFLYNFQDYQSEEFDKTENGYYDHNRQMMVERKIASKNDAKNPFRVSGEFCAIGLHTSYDHKLWMCEQGGITCKKEADAQIEDLDMLQFYQFWEGAPQKPRDIVVYPGTGCPWMTIADVDISQYGVSESNPINYYFTKDNMGSTITVRVCDNDFIYPDIWQSVEFGRFTHMEGNVYPLYVGGGSLPLYPDWWNYFALDHIYGQQYNLSMKNPALANSNILHTTKFGKANLSNFRVMTPDGLWKDIYSAYQEYKDIHYFTLAGFVPRWGECVLPHTYDSSLNTGAELVDTVGKVGLLNITKDSDKINKAYEKYFEKTNLDEITVHLNHNYNDEIYTASGVIPRVYASWSRHLEQGLHSSNGRYWLAIPNGWQDRLWHYKFYYGRIYWEGKNEKSEWDVTPRGLEQLEYVRDEYHMLTEGRYNDKMINDKLIVDFGKAPVECSDLQIDFPEDYPTSKDANLALRCLVYAQADTIEFSLYVEVQAIEVDFGDGSKIKFNKGEQLKHTYSTTGDYYVNVYVSNAVSSCYHCLKYSCDTNTTGLIYSSGGRNNVVKKLYINPYVHEPIYADNYVLDDRDATENVNPDIIYIYNQQSLTDLYLTYLLKPSNNILVGSSNILNSLWNTIFTLVNCNNINNIYIFNDFINDYSTIRDNFNIACLNIINSVDNKEVNIYVSDGYNRVIINDYELRSSIWSDRLVNGIKYYPTVNLYLYNKTSVSVGFLLYGNRNKSLSNFNLHVPTELFEDYNVMYGAVSNVLSISGDIL